MKYYTLTFGCQMNKSDSERIAAILESAGYKPVSKLEQADLVVVNMCSVRQSAVDRVFGLAPKFNEIMSHNKNSEIILTGCFLKKDKKKFLKIFNQVISIDEFFKKFSRKNNYLKMTPKHSNKFSAFVPISNGCVNFCSYCVVPFTRGPLVCRNHKEILEEIKCLVHPVKYRSPRLNNFAKGKIRPKAYLTGQAVISAKPKLFDRVKVKKGFKEIWLLGQNVNDYQSPSDSSVDFAKLFKMIESIPGNFKIFFLSPNPNNFSEELIDILSKSKKFGKRLNLPIQSGDNKILKKMNRPYTVAQYKNLVRKIRRKIPDIDLSTDVIVGFPGETKKQFRNTAKLFKEVGFNVAFIAKYSPRPGTAAFKMKDNVPLKEKKRREKILREIINN